MKYAGKVMESINSIRDLVAIATVIYLRGTVLLPSQAHGRSVRAVVGVCAVRDETEPWQGTMALSSSFQRAVDAGRGWVHLSSHTNRLSHS